MRDYPAKIPIGPIGKGAWTCQNVVFTEDGVARPFVRNREVVVALNQNLTFCMPVTGSTTLWYDGSAYLRRGNGNIVSSVAVGPYVRAFGFPNGVYFLYDGNHVYECVGSSLIKKLSPSNCTPSVACNYNDTSVVLARFRVGSGSNENLNNAFWISSPLGVDIGNIHTLSFNDMTGRSAKSDGVFSTYVHYPPVFGIIPSEDDITAVAQVADSIAFFTKKQVYFGRFSDGVFVFQSSYTPIPVSNHYQVWATHDMCYVLSDDHKLYVIISTDSKLLFDFNVMPSSKARPTMIYGAAGDTVLLDGYVFTPTGVTGPLVPQPIGFCSYDGDVAFTQLPVDQNNNIDFLIESDWVMDSVQGLFTLNSVCFDAIHTSSVKISVDYVSERESRRSAILSTPPVNVKPDSPAIIRRTGSNFRFKYSGKMNYAEGRIAGGIARIQTPDYRYIRGPFGTPQAE